MRENENRDRKWMRFRKMGNGDFWIKLKPKLKINMGIELRKQGRARWIRKQNIASVEELELYLKNISQKE